MARIGINPARGKTTDAKPQRITVGLITYIPEQAGYFAHRLDVLRLVLDSLSAHTSLPHDVLVFDNASCPAAVELLRSAQAAGKVNFLLLADRNIGKIDALRVLAQAAPGEIIAYSDDDILFYPGWLEAHLALLERFPGAGMVSGAPVRNAAGHARGSLDALAANPPTGVTVSTERRILDEWEADWAASTGRDPQAHLQATAGSQDLVFRYQDAHGELEAIAAANHFQFVARKTDLLRALPQGWSGKLMGSMIELDEAMDGLGLLRLSTAQRYTRHLGNALSPQVVEDARRLGLSIDQAAPAAVRAGARRRPLLLRLPGARRLLTAIYNAIFRLLYA
jgi:glycosyltransferase involved in cell wall biosynthesis